MDRSSQVSAATPAPYPRLELHQEADITLRSEITTQEASKEREKPDEVGSGQSRNPPPTHTGQQWLVPPAVQQAISKAELPSPIIV